MEQFVQWLIRYTNSQCKNFFVHTLKLPYSPYSIWVVIKGYFASKKKIGMPIFNLLATKLGRQRPLCSVFVKMSYWLDFPGWFFALAPIFQKTNHKSLRPWKIELLPTWLNQWRLMSIWKLRQMLVRFPLVRPHDENLKLFFSILLKIKIWNTPSVRKWALYFHLKIFREIQLEWDLSHIT